MTNRFLRFSLLLTLLFSTAYFTGILNPTTVYSQSTETSLSKKIKSLKGVVNITKLECNPHFKEKYLVNIKQWLDPKDTTAGSFVQRVFVMHISEKSPVALVTEGYGGAYAERVNYIEELSKLYKTNVIFVEHRYFEKSVPEKPDWKYLTVAGAAADHHHVCELFKKIYKGKWINTGISKGGETALVHRALYPNDVDFTVAYVGPLCFGLEDGRHEPFINKVATESGRKKVRDFQLEVLKRREHLMPKFKQYCEDYKYTFRLPLDEIYDYCVLEYSFSFWQWGWQTYFIPSSTASDDLIFAHLIKVCSPDYFSLEGMAATQAFFIQAAKELGYYGYETKPFEEYLKIKTAKDYLKNIFIPKELNIDFDSTISQQCARFIKDNDMKMIFIYGEYDPWSAAAVNFTGKKNMFKYINPGGNHTTRIESFPDSTKKEIKDKISGWLR
jgi:hypothetical protein